THSQRLRGTDFIHGLLVVCGSVWPSEATLGVGPDLGFGDCTDQFEAGQASASMDTVWWIESEPILELGLIGGADQYEFFQIQGATRLSTGAIVVLDGGSSQLRAFSPDGNHVWTAGGRGDGPGEMKSPTHIERLPDDFLQVQDGVYRIRYAPDGTLAAHDRLAVEDLSALRFFAWECPVPGFVGDHVLACRSNSDVRQMPRQTGPWRIETQLALLPWQLNDITLLGRFLQEEAWVLPLEQTEFAGLRGYASPPMSQRGLFAVGGWPRKLVFAENSADFVQVFDFARDSVPHGVSISIRNVRRPPTADELAAAWEAASDRRLNRDRVGYLKTHLPSPDSIPNLEDLVVDDLGMVWVGSYHLGSSAPQWYDVYDTQGLLLARVAIPTGVEVLEIGSDYVLGITRDDLGVERIVLLNLVRGVGTGEAGQGSTDSVSTNTRSFHVTGGDR
ncbi:MAG: hypothetical protein OXQ32_08720, partial [bacterium]|nr:hypothetical protein [bacterium]